MKRLFPGRAVICLLGFVCAAGCTLQEGGLTSGPVNTGTVTDLPSSPAEVNETVCVGVSPEASAWLADPYPVRFPVVDPDAQQGQGARTDVIGDVTTDADAAGEPEDVIDENPSAARSPDPDADAPREVDADVDPCVAEPGTCLGAPPPEWALLDFQPQSCGSGATYGLQAFHGHVTVMALFASW